MMLTVYIFIVLDSRIVWKIILLLFDFELIDLFTIFNFIKRIKLKWNTNCFILLVEYFFKSKQILLELYLYSFFWHKL